ncbi:MAG: T9SS type A sorting domain-containing protein [Bacteroidia bacterium]|nr:T9SS type A sorting domain-containing protein [Bacteroidia bacterium]
MKSPSTYVATPNLRSITALLGSVAVLFLVLTSSASAQYCTAGSTYCGGGDEQISNVTVAGINNNSGCGTGGYSDYTATVTPGAMTAGSSYPISVTNLYAYTGDQVNVWVDWNNNNVFTDAGEAFLLSTTNNALFTGNITCPVGTLTGNKRMRVRLSYYPTLTNLSCGVETFGEVEDYTIAVTGLGDPPPTISLTSSPACGSTANQTVVANITDNGTVAAAVIWFRKNTGTWYNANPTSTVGSTYTFTINHATVGGVVPGDVIWWYIGARDNLNGVATLPSGGSGTTPPGSTPPPAPNSYGIAVSLPYSQSFDAVGHGWTFGGTASTWRVGTPVGLIGTTAASPPNALLWQTTSGQYANNEQSWAMSPPMSFTGLINDPVIAFSQKRNIENVWDGTWVEYTTNNGTNWITLGTFPPGPSSLNWYTVGSLNSAPNQPSWTADSYTAWVRSVHTLTGLAGQSCVRIRIRAASDGSVVYSGMAIDDLVVGDFPQKDIEVVSANVSYAVDRWAQVQGQPHTVSAVIKTNGWETPPTSVTLVYKAGSVPASTGDGVSQTFSPTWASGQATVNFSTPYTPTALGPVTVHVRAFYTGDGAPGNDSKSYIMNVQTDKVYGFEDFEGLPASGLPNFRTGWTVINNGGANTWGVYIYVPTASTIAGYLTDLNANDYLISPPALLRAGSSYRVRFKYGGCPGAAGPITLALLVGQTPNPATMSVVNTWVVPQTGVAIDAAGVIPGTAPYFNTDPSAPANYYIAFHATNPSGANSCVAIDDIIMDDNPSPPPKIGYGFPGSPITSYVDDPGIPIQITANYKQPGLINKTYAVSTTTNIFGTLGDFLWDVTTTTPWITLTKSTPDPTLQGYNFTPPRPRQFQTFTMTIDPSGLPIGVHRGELQFYGMLFNNDFPPPMNGLRATNEVFRVVVELRVVASGGGYAPTSQSRTLGPMTAPNTYIFTDAATGDPIGTVHMTSGTVNSMTITVFPNQLPQNLARMHYVKRYWQITHSGGSWTADITFPYAPQEAAMVQDPLQLRGVRQAVMLGQWENPIAGTTSASDPANSQVKVFSLNPGNVGGNIALAHPYGFVKADGDVPVSFSLDQNYPNPFNPSTSISFGVAEERTVRIVVYNQLGAEVAELVNETMPAGRYTTLFDARDLPSGTYICRMIAGDYVKTIQMMLSK